MLYWFTLLAHSWLRWAVLIFAAVALVRGVRGWRGRLPFTTTDQRFLRLFIAAMDTQVLLGLILYVALSPFVPRTLEDLRASMRVSVLRFFAVEHLMTMLLALIAAHVASVYARRAPEPAARHKRIVIGVLVALALVLVGIPWPFLKYGRPLFRFS